MFPDKSPHLALLVPFFKAHLLQPFLSVELIVAGVCAVAKIFHVGSDQHLSQLGEVAVVFVLHLKRRAQLANNLTRNEYDVSCHVLFVITLIDFPLQQPETISWCNMQVVT